MERTQLSLHAEGSELPLGNTPFKRPYQNFQTIVLKNLVKVCVTTEIDWGKKFEKTISARWLHKVPNVLKVRCLKTLPCVWRCTSSHTFIIPLKIMPKSNPKQPICCYQTPLKTHCRVPFSETHSIQWYFVFFSHSLNVFTFSSKPRRTSEPFAFLM